MTISLSLIEYAALSSEEKMASRIKLAAEIVEFSEGKLVEIGAEPSHYDWDDLSRLPAIKTDRHGQSTDVIAKKLAANPKDVEKKWILIDAEGITLGRLATIVAMRLTGKHEQTSFTRDKGIGDEVIIINAAKIQFTGANLENKVNIWHPSHRSAPKVRDGWVVGALFKAVALKISRNALGPRQLSNLHVYLGAQHSYISQNVEVLEISNPSSRVHISAGRKHFRFKK